MQRFLTVLCIVWVSVSFAHDINPVEPSIYIQQDPLIPSNPTQSIPVLEPHKSPFLAVGLSVVLPGLGHLYLGDYKTASEFFLVSLGGRNLQSVKDLREHIGATLAYTWCYGIFATYRDVRIFNQEMGYRYKIPKDTLRDLSLAPFRWRVMEKPEVWGGLLGYLAAGTVITHLVFKDAKHTASSIQDRKENPLIAFPVGIGEEALFRGYLQSYLSEIFTVPGGIALSSILFAAAHIPNANDMSKKDQSRYYTYILPYLASFGAYEGWVAYKNQSLQESVAIHAWYDFVLFSLSYMATPATISKPCYATSFTF